MASQHTGTDDYEEGEIVDDEVNTEMTSAVTSTEDANACLETQPLSPIRLKRHGNPNIASSSSATAKRRKLMNDQIEFVKEAEVEEGEVEVEDETTSLAPPNRRRVVKDAHRISQKVASSRSVAHHETKRENVIDNKRSFVKNEKVSESTQDLRLVLSSKHVGFNNVKRNVNRAKRPRSDTPFRKRIGVAKNRLGIVRYEGNVVTLYRDQGYGFVNTPVETACGDAIFYLNKLKVADFLVMKGDRLEFGLGGKSGSVAKNPKLVHCYSRDDRTIRKYLRTSLKHVKESLTPVQDNADFILELLSCSAIARAIGDCEHMSNSTKNLTLKLMCRLKGIRNSEYFRLFLSAFSETRFLQGTSSPLAQYIDGCLQNSLSSDLKKVKAFLKILVQTLPQKAGIVASLVEPLVSREKGSTETFLYDLLCATAKLTTESIKWNELPLTPSNSELVLDGPLASYADLSPVKVEGPYESADEYVDTYFRLLRVDCFDAIRRGIHDLMQGQLDLRDMNVYDNVSLEGILPSHTETGIQLALKVTLRKSVRWATSSDLKFGNLLCLTATGTFKDAIWATVANRDEKMLAKGVIIAELCSEGDNTNSASCITNLVRSSGSFLMVESPTYYKAYQPVLRSLQTLDLKSLPFYEELVCAHNPQKPPSYITELMETDSNFTEKKITHASAVPEEYCYSPPYIPTSPSYGPVPATYIPASPTCSPVPATYNPVSPTYIPTSPLCGSMPLDYCSLTNFTNQSKIFMETDENWVIDNSNEEDKGDNGSCNITTEETIVSKECEDTDLVVSLDSGPCSSPSKDVADTVLALDDPTEKHTSLENDAVTTEKTTALCHSLTEIIDVKLSDIEMIDASNNGMTDNKDLNNMENSTNSQKTNTRNRKEFEDHLLKTLADGGIILDDSQNNAIKLALNQRVGIIQGPPGTGKTFIGVQLVKLIRSVPTHPRSPILVLTCKNHALDEFLKEMIKLYPRGVVRIGGRSSDPGLEQYNLKSFRKQKHDSIDFDKILNVEQKLIQERIGVVTQRLSDAHFFSPECLFESFDETKIKWMLLSCEWTKVRKNSYRIRRFVQEYDLETLKSTLLNQEDLDAAGKELQALFREAVELWTPPAEIFHELERSSRPLQLSHKVTTALKSGKKNSMAEDTKRNPRNTDDNIYDYQDLQNEQRERILLNLPRPRGSSADNIVWLQSPQTPNRPPRLLESFSAILSNIPDTFLDLFDDPWELDVYDRAKLVHFLLLCKVKKIEEELKNLLNEHQSLYRRRKELEDNFKMDCIINKKVIGMTITGASIHQQLLARVKPAIVIVEEAAEVLEPQLIAVLGEWVQHLILIGDHNQLPPQVECYTLEKDFHFDLSLMERLIKNDYNYATLSKQNRMRPEFAELLLDIYPNLESNLDRVERNHSAQSMVRSMFFWNHDNEESSDRSVTNEAEAEMVVKLALFLVQQQYKPKQITILAAYQGQVRLLRKKIRDTESKYPELFNEKEPTQMEAQDEQDETTRRKISIMVHTIDFYQGDENEVVIVSLVRSNPQGYCGFLKKLNRRCVSQSRAKCGLYFVGNAETLRKNGHWNRMIQQMELKNCVGNSIELCCPQHRTSSVLKAESAAQIPIDASFCKEYCDQLMSCEQHRCPRKCQPPHTHILCKVQVPFQYPNCQHPGSKRCYEDPWSKSCLKRIQFENECGHLAVRPCHDTGKVKCNEPCPKVLSCKGKHPCPGKCGDLCDHKNCPQCAEIAKVEAEKQRKADREAKKRAITETKKEIAELRKAPTKTWFRRRDLLDSGDTALEYREVKETVLKFIQLEQNWYPSVRAIEKITNVPLEKKWLDFKLKRIPTRNAAKCYQCPTKDVDNISRDGFWKTKGKYGWGVHFTSKSRFDSQEMNSLDLHHLLLCDVLIGKSKTLTGASHDVTLAELIRQHYDSVFEQGEEEKDDDTVIVFDRNQAIPRYIICYAFCDYSSTEDAVRNLEKCTKEFKHYHITPKREITLNDPLEHHFRMAESQFNRMAQRHQSMQYKVQSVDYYVNPPLLNKFNQTQASMEAKYGAGSPESKFILGFHGTCPSNFDAIVKMNFDVSKARTCAYGLGIYFSEFPDVSITYSGGCKKLLLCKILPGKSFDVDGHSYSQKPLKPGYDSHRARKDSQGNGWAVVIDNPDQILPCYVISYS